MTAAATTRKIRIMLIEDHVLVRMGLVTAANNEPDLEVVAEVEDGRLAVQSYRLHRVDVVVLDLRMPGVDGIEVIKMLQNENATARILVLSSYAGGDDISRAMHEGASGYVVKGMGLDHLLQGIRTVHAGKRYLPAELSSRLNRQKTSDISTRELEVLRLIVQGKSNKEIASQMGIVEGTVKAHLVNIFGKLGAVDRSQAVAIAIKRQLLEVE